MVQIIPAGYDCEISVHYYVTNNITLNFQNKNEWNAGINISYFIFDDGQTQFAYGHWKGMT